jgi:8-oxo-dGTP pyrophosphatase MutT (NUDIX family)
MNSSGPRPRLARTYETSAGGFVLSADGKDQVALIARVNRGGKTDWCIPKGHPENEEDLRQAAIREIGEETGILGEILADIGQIKYDFSAGRKKITKTVHHFLLIQTGGHLTVENDPQREASAVEWVSINEAQDRLTHENEKRMAQEMLRVIEELGL